VGVLEWILIIEGVCLVTAGVFNVAGLVIGRGDPDDPFTAFYQTFWRVFLRKRGRLRSAVTQLDVDKARKYDEMKQSGDVEGIKSLLENEFGGHAFDESEISDALDESVAGAQQYDAGAAGEPARTRVAQLTVKVIPFAQKDELVSMRRDGISIQVTCGPEEGQANKAVIDLVAQALAIKPYQVTLLKGHYKPFKTVQVAGFNQSELDLKMASYS
jgi:uncharacterized protein YggU (UPF0235/DUF167 family)